VRKDNSFIAMMFDSIAFRYDFLNHLLSFGTDRLWRKKAVRQLAGKYDRPDILDVATGTGDLSIAALKLNPAHITGIDISDKMLDIGRKKINKKRLSGLIEMKHGDSENIQFSDNSFDIAMVAFGVRNFSSPVDGLCEMHRVLKHGGTIMVLEFSKPVFFPFRLIYNFYFLRVLPLFGRFFSGDRRAYSYLPDSVMQFPDNEIFMEMLGKAGFNEIHQKKLTGGIATIYTGLKS